MSDRAEPAKRNRSRNTQSNAPAKPSKSGSETRQRQAALRLRVTEAERAEIEAKAERAGLTVAGYVRAAIFGKDTDQPRAARRPPVEKAELVSLRYELRKIGGNLNQIAHKLNQGKDFDPRAFAAIYAEHAAALRAIMEALGKEPPP